MRSLTTSMKRASAAKKRSGAGRCEQAIRSYFGGILNGEITACEKMHQLAERVLRDLDITARNLRQSTLYSSRRFAAYRPASLGANSSLSFSSLPSCR